jgi:putative LysE/RhtB family amino acid efflux pump
VGAEAILFLKAAAAGLAVSIPPGPVAALCAGRAMRGGAGAGIVWALGAALADALHGAAAAAGAAVPLPVVIAGAVALGLALRKRRPAAAAGGFLIALASPATLPALAVLYGTLGVAGHAAIVGAGVFFGAALWWVILATAAARLRRPCAP